jgi:hypothetical protein
VAAIPIGVWVHENAAALLCVRMLKNDELAAVASCRRLQSSGLVLAIKRIACSQ